MIEFSTDFLDRVDLETQLNKAYNDQPDRFEEFFLLGGAHIHAIEVRLVSLDIYFQHA